MRWVPAKSGVSGGTLAVVPGKMGIGAYSPGLDDYGNSVRGGGVCQEISDRLGLTYLPPRLRIPCSPQNRHVPRTRSTLAESRRATVDVGGDMCP